MAVIQYLMLIEGLLVAIYVFLGVIGFPRMIGGLLAALGALVFGVIALVLAVVFFVVISVAAMTAIAGTVLLTVILSATLRQHKKITTDIEGQFPRRVC